MSITDYDGFNRLCELCGIVESYYDICGVHHIASVEVKQSLLAAMRIGNSHNNDEEIHASLEKIRQRDWQYIVNPVHVYVHSDNAHTIALTLNPSQTGQPIHWQIIEDNGHIHKGNWQFDEHNAVDECEIAGTRCLRFYVSIPPISDIGYHTLNLQLADGASASSLLIATPETCYQPESFTEGKKAWGVSLQLYTLRSKRNWGIGDFTDLSNVIDILAPKGVDVVGLNPLHTLFTHLPENASPYSPSNRDFLNPVYLDIEAISEFKLSGKARKLVSSVDFQSGLQSLRDASLVHYTGVWQAKLSVLELLYEQFRKEIEQPGSGRVSAGRIGSDRVNQFRQYQADGGQDLFRFSLFEALQLFFNQQDAATERWQQWPNAFHDPESNSVKDWAESNLDKIEFHTYLQWLSVEQLSAVQQNCQRKGMRIGLYNDLAVGNEPFSSACWAEQPNYGLGIGVGAPPDDFNLLGQNWGLPPQLPQSLRDDRYRLFINTLRANMRHAGALRIDHVMGLMRLYWVPEGYTADLGAYVCYPFIDLLGILSLESQRNRCLIVGEDLGTVADEVRHQLWLKKILSYRVLFFEKDWQQNTLKSPGEYPQYALCTSGSHDLPTMKAYWQGLDLDLREALNLYPSDEVKHQQRQARGSDLHAIKQALNHEQMISDETLHTDTKTELSWQMFQSIQCFLARSQSLLMMVQLEDIFSQTDQVNVPGTVNEYPNWRHKITVEIEDWIEGSDIESLASSIGRERS
jgi:(1->4)-alpha-D-glucan 1-alpha-D-glucosylmutase